MRVAVLILLTDEELATLTKWAHGRSTEARLVLRAKIVLAAADGSANKVIASELGTDSHTVARWRNRFEQKRLPGIMQDAPRGGRPPKERQSLVAEIIRKT